MSFEPLDDVRHILDEVEVLLHASAGVDESAFFADATLQRAFVRSLEVIGEGTKRLPLEVRLAHPDVDWRGVAGMRVRLRVRRRSWAADWLSGSDWWVVRTRTLLPKGSRTGSQARKGTGLPLSGSPDGTA